MDKINWKAKLTSRKFWLAVAGLVVGVLALLGTDANTTQQISGVIMALGSVVAYIAGEGYVDGQAATSTVPDYTGQLIGTVPDSGAANTDSTGAAQAAEVKQDTADSIK